MLTVVWLRMRTLISWTHTDEVMRCEMTRLAQQIVFYPPCTPSLSGEFASAIQSSQDFCVDAVGYSHHTTPTSSHRQTLNVWLCNASWFSLTKFQDGNFAVKHDSFDCTRRREPKHLQHIRAIQHATENPRHSKVRNAGDRVIKIEQKS